MRVVMQIERSIDSHRAWREIPVEIRKRLEAVSKFIDFKRGDNVWWAGDRPQGLFIVNKGLIGLSIIGSSGKEHLLRFCKEGQFFGHRSLFADEVYNASAVALEPTSLRSIPRQEILQIFDEHPAFYQSVIKVLSKELRRAEMNHVMILENQILTRTAQTLVYLKDLHPHHRWTRHEIASFCASTASTVIKALAQLEDKGLISQKGREIEILDRKALLSLHDKDQK